jgi:hypothetical protein
MKHKITAITFFAVIFALSAANTLDGEVFREPFRRIKAVFDMNVLQKLDNNGVFIENGYMFKTDYPLNEASVLRLCEIINEMKNRHLDAQNKVYFAIAPDKNAFLEGSGRLVLDYSHKEELIRTALHNDIAYVDISGGLGLESYYRTDSHWRQEKLFPVVDILAAEMGFRPHHKPFTEENFNAFYGVYCRQSALRAAPDNLVWLVSETTRNAGVTSLEKPGQSFPVYDLSRLDGPDPYNIFLCGPAAVVTAQNPADTSGRRLILFRDSFASPLAPLLLDAYSEIILIDLRYLHPALLAEAVDFSGADVLFIYSSGLFNNSGSVRSGG